MSYTWRTIKTDRGDHGVRVDRVLLRHLRDERSVSRNRIQKWIEAGDVLVNGAPPSRAAWRVQAGDDLQVRIEELPARTRPSGEAMDLQVLYEDDDLLAVDKPAGLVVHPSYKNAAGTLINGVLERAKTWPAGSRPSLLGRLDKYLWRGDRGQATGRARSPAARDGIPAHRQRLRGDRLGPAVTDARYD